MFDLQQYLATQRAMIDERLHSYFNIPVQLPAQAKILEAMSYSVFAGGKRLRPILCLAAAQAVGGSAEAVLGAACSLELLHTYSLIHDDLPCMDNDDYRRGKLTNHKVFGENTAVLAGDALLTMAFEILSQDAAHDPRVVVRVVQEVAKAAGHQGMVAGQVMDLLSEHQRLTHEQIQQLHQLKTGALIEASLKTGALLSGADEEALQALTQYGQAYGLGFQITDDILDVVGDTRIMGKEAGRDQAQEKATYPALFGIEVSRKLALEAANQAKQALAKLPGDTKPLGAMADYLTQRES